MFYKSSQPKSLGVEFLTLEIFSLLNSFSLSNVGVLRTFIERIAIQVTQKIKKKVFLLQVEKLIHFFLLERIRDLGTNIEIAVPDAKNS